MDQMEGAVPTMVVTQKVLNGNDVASLPLFTAPLGPIKHAEPLSVTHSAVGLMLKLYSSAFGDGGRSGI